MIGGIIGDVVGSFYEFCNIKTKDFELFSDRDRFTDDSVLTIATADWLIHGGSPANYYAKWGNRFPSAGYGGSFHNWLSAMDRYGSAEPYNSFGNGSAMRVGPVGWAFDSKEDTLDAAKLSAECTHYHPEGIKGAQAVALAIFMEDNRHNNRKVLKKLYPLKTISHYPHVGPTSRPALLLSA